MKKLIKVFHTARDEGFWVLIEKIIWRIRSAGFRKPPDEIGLCFQTLEADKESGFMMMWGLIMVDSFHLSWRTNGK